MDGFGVNMSKRIRIVLQDVILCMLILAALWWGMYYVWFLTNESYLLTVEALGDDRAKEKTIAGLAVCILVIAVNSYVLFKSIYKGRKQ